MSFAAPVGRDGFHYNGDLYVETGNHNRHKRATIPEITAILRPDLKKPKSVATASPPKDPVGHWYEAQLIHYGLPLSKDKARAKMRLLEALNESKLVVPAGIVKLEADLKKEYMAADRKAKAQYKASLATGGKGEEAMNTKKRKQPEATNSVNVNINFGPYGPAAFPMMAQSPGSGNGSTPGRKGQRRKPRLLQTPRHQTLGKLHQSRPGRSKPREGLLDGPERPHLDPGCQTMKTSQHKSLSQSESRPRKPQRQGRTLQQNQKPLQIQRPKSRKRIP